MPETVRATEELRRRRDQAARELNLESAFVAPRSTLEAIATNEARAASLLVPWQQELLGIAARYGETTVSQPVSGNSGLN